MKKHEDTWLSDIFKCPVFRIDVGKEDYFKLELSELCFAYAKVAVKDIALVKRFTDYGFFIVDTNISYIYKGINNKLVSTDLVIRLAEPKDEDAVRHIAATSFTVTRFHVDPYIDNTLANRIKYEWAGNYFSGKRGDEMIVAERNGRVIGFSQILLRDGIAVIDLIAVETNSQGQGVGRFMIAELQERYDIIHIGTQLANNNSIALYEKMGFCFDNASYVLHFHGIGKG